MSRIKHLLSVNTLCKSIQVFMYLMLLRGCKAVAKQMRRHGNSIQGLHLE